MASTAVPETPRTQVSPQDDTSPSNAAERDENEWSEDEDALDVDDDGRKRKRQRVSRQISVSCERCKERKVADSSRRLHVI